LRQNLENFSQAVSDYRGLQGEAAVYGSFQAALTSVFEEARGQRLVLVIDQYPYVARADKALASTLQALLDKYRDSSQLMLILCGSSMSYMEDKVLAYKSPLYGRRTGQIKLQPFSFAETAAFGKGFSALDKALLYGVAGGTPQYLLQMDGSLSMQENICRTFLSSSSAIFEEPLNLLKQEVREPAVYNAIITAVANGATRLSEISTKVGEDSAVCASYLRSLMELGLVTKETPYGEKPGRKTIYLLADNMFRFWYRFVPQNSSLILRGAGQLAYQRIEGQLTTYMGSVFEEICRQYLWHRLLQGSLPLFFSELGRWWGNDPSAHKQTELDLLAYGEDSTALCGECKWINEPVGESVLATLQHRSTLFPQAKKYLFLFAKAGFTAACRQRAEQLGNVELITYREILAEMVQEGYI